MLCEHLVNLVGNRHIFVAFPCKMKMGHTVVKLVEALRYNPEDRGFDSRCHWKYFIDIILPAALWP
jgi:hypothetical protein